MCSVMRLPYYLIMPIQRIPRYRLLLQELLRNTDCDHPDFENVRLTAPIVLNRLMHQ